MPEYIELCTAGSKSFRNDLLGRVICRPESIRDLNWQLQLLNRPSDVVQEVHRLGSDAPDLLLLHGQIRIMSQQKNLEDGTP